jgi:RNA polymerase sigma-70 factor, ECF subfamily
MLASDIVFTTPALQIDATISDQTADDHDLLRQVATGDGQAFETLYTRYMPRVQSYLRKRLSDPEIVDEVLNDVMIVIWHKATACPDNVPLLAWLYGIARNTARSSTHRFKHQEAEPEKVVTVEEDPEFHLLQQDQQQRLARAISALPRHERQPIEFLVYHGCSYKDIAARLDLPVNTIKTRVIRARTRLATAMAS